MIYILAGNKDEYMHFLNEAGLSEDCINVSYLDNVNILKNNNAKYIIQYGTYKTRKDYYKFQKEVKIKDLI